MWLAVPAPHPGPAQCPAPQYQCPGTQPWEAAGPPARAGWGWYLVPLVQRSRGGRGACASQLERVLLSHCGPPSPWAVPRDGVCAKDGHKLSPCLWGAQQLLTHAQLLWPSAVGHLSPEGDIGMGLELDMMTRAPGSTGLCGRLTARLWRGPDGRRWHRWVSQLPPRRLSRARLGLPRPCRPENGWAWKEESSRRRQAPVWLALGGEGQFVGSLPLHPTACHLWGTPLGDQVSQR